MAFIPPFDEKIAISLDIATAISIVATGLGAAWIYAWRVREAKQDELARATEIKRLEFIMDGLGQASDQIRKVNLLPDVMDDSTAQNFSLELWRIKEVLMELCLKARLLVSKKDDMEPTEISKRVDDAYKTFKEKLKSQSIDHAATNIIKLGAYELQYWFSGQIAVAFHGKKSEAITCDLRTQVEIRRREIETLNK